MKFSNEHPIYLQIKNDVYYRICKGKLRPGDRLSSVRDYAIEVGVNPNTVQRTYSDMEREGIVEKRRGQGSYVTEDSGAIQRLRTQMAVEQVQLFYSSMTQMGFTDEEIVDQVQCVMKEGGTS
ncbi:GntR family transcriptional regulator [Paenibacillus sp. Marseille-Q4541]|uniref:GntR family transcriptional regulator n=1 Tax=Paenibacillus sp. Marseille-Q4541 TaxID=2831522 RepID=UPI001BA73489|nr:GntR family transcriptional regulator [Paenibacillus sp. Marseille-Q4541]